MNVNKPANKQRRLITVKGVVQGVGFRPLVYRLAVELGLKGFVLNTSGSVEIDVEGKSDAIDSFLARLPREVPAVACVEKIVQRPAPLQHYADFRIRESRPRAGDYQLVSPDIATCPDCLREILDPTNRRYRYPFTNCTHCGPRFTIIEDIPYDRPFTTMRAFTMCPACQKEYDDPGDRRFHAQPNACPVCGPRLELVDAAGKKIPGDVIKKAAQLFKKGKIIALRGLGGFQLACDATNPTAVQMLRERKHRPDKPFAVMLTDIAAINVHCRITKAEEKLLQSPAAPIVLADWKKSASKIAEAVAPRINSLGVMLPYTPLHHLLLRETGLPLVMTSGNLSEEPIAKDNGEALERLQNIADYFILHNREIYARYDDSVYVVENRQPAAVRRARGFAPYPIHLPFRAGQILACGAELKNTFCLTRENHAFISQHIGDMENAETLEHYEQTVDLYRKLFRVQPAIVACDLHPEYLPGKFAAEYAASRGLPLVKVQHHHAHIVSCMVENGLSQPVIGVAFDGVGYGSDGNLWGGEFMIVEPHKFARVGQLEYVPMPGGALAIKKPYRMALGHIYSLLDKDFKLAGPLAKIPAAELRIIKQQIEKGLNSPLTSSAGRLFDAVAAICGVCNEASYEAQAAIELEMLASKDAGADPRRLYPFSLERQGGVEVVKLGALLSAVIDDVRNQVPVPRVSLKMHQTVAEIIAAVCRRISPATGLKQVALSGGVFQNRLLLKLTCHKLKEAGFQVFTHHLVPCNDGGIALGQAVVTSQKKG